MAEYKYVDWPGLQYYHSKVTDLIDSRLRQCIRFGEETLYVDLESPDTNDLNIVIRIIDSFTVQPSDTWFDETLWNNTYPAGTLLQVVQKSLGVVYTVFLQPASNSGGGSTPEVDLSNYYTKDEVDAKILEALRPYATVEFVTAKLEAIQELLDTQIDNFGTLTNRVASLEETISTNVEPAITQLEAAVTKIAEEKADKSEIPSLEGYATEHFVAAKIAEAELAGGDVDLSAYYTKDETYSKDEVNTLIPDVSDVARKSDLEGLATEQFVATVVGAIEIPEVPTKVSELENDRGYLTEHQDISGKSDVGHKHSISDITDYSEPDLSEYAKKEDIPDVSDFATEDFVKQKIAEAQLSGGDVDLSAFYTREEIDAKGFATQEYVQQQLDEADVVGVDERLTVIETQTETVTTRLDSVEDQAAENEASITALSGEIDRVDDTLLEMDTQITTLSQNLEDLKTYGTF